MAEKVEIRGGDLDGSVLTNAASEVTLKRLADAFDKKFGTGSGSKIFEVQEKTVKNNITAVKQSTGAMSAYDNTLGKLNKRSEDLSKKFAEMGGLAISGLFSGIAGAGKMLLNFFTDGLDSLRHTSQVGATFNNDLVELRRAAASAAMPLDMFTETISKNSQVLAMFGGTVTQGAKRFGDLSKELRTGDIGQAFFGMGMTMGDLNEYMADYLEIEMKSGRIKGRSDAELIQGTQNYILEIDRLTKVTGQSRKQTSDALKQNQADARLSVLRRKLGAEEARKFDESLGLMRTSLKDQPQAFESLANMMAGIVKPGDDFAKALLTADPSIMGFMQQMGQGKRGSEEFAERMRKLRPAIEAQIDALGGSVVTYNDAFAALENFGKGLTVFEKQNNQAAKAEQDRRNKITEALGGFAQTFEKIKSDIMIALVDSKVFERLTNGLKALASTFMEYVPKITPVITRLIGEFDGLITRFLDKIDSDGIGAAIADFFKGLLAKIFGKTGSPEQDAKRKQNSEAIGNIRNREGEIQGRLQKLQEDPSKATDETVKETKLLQDELSVLQDARKRLVDENNKMEDSLRGGLFTFDWGTISSGIKGFTELLAPLGYALGGLVAVAVAIPAVAAGKLLALGAAIGMTAGGIGYMLQGVGTVIEQSAKALDMMPESLRKFETLDVERLKVVGPALAELTKPLMQAGFAGLLSSIGGDGLPKLSSAIRDFENVNPEKIREVGPALKVLNEGLAALTGGGQGGVLQAFTGAIARFLTGDNGLGQFADSFKKFNDIDASNIKNLVSGLDDIKSKIGEDFKKQASNVDTFATSIKNLRKDLEGLKTALDALNKGTGALGGGPSALTQVVSQISQVGGRGATTEMLEEQKKLNTLITELKPVFEATRDNTKDTADGVSGRRSLTER